MNRALIFWLATLSLFVGGTVLWIGANKMMDANDSSGNQGGIVLDVSPPLTAFTLTEPDAMAVPPHVFRERRDDTVRVDVRSFQCGGQIEQVAPLLTLIQRPQLGSEVLVELVALNLAGSFEPARSNCEGVKP